MKLSMSHYFVCTKEHAGARVGQGEVGRRYNDCIVRRASHMALLVVHLGRVVGGAGIACWIAGWAEGGVWGYRHGLQMPLCRSVFRAPPASSSSRSTSRQKCYSLRHLHRVISPPQIAQRSHWNGPQNSSSQGSQSNFPSSSRSSSSRRRRL